VKIVRWSVFGVKDLAKISGVGFRRSQKSRDAATRADVETVDEEWLYE
jgi:hypothetical protein